MVNDISQEIYMSTNYSISSFVCTPYIGAFFIHILGNFLALKNLFILENYLDGKFA
jgi:hypothetical protein